MDPHSTGRTSRISVRIWVFVMSGRHLSTRKQMRRPTQFMRIREKLYQISELTGSNFKQETYRLLRIYRATPHCTTKFAPADFMYSDCKFHTSLPIGVTAREHDFDELYQRDVEKKMQKKSYADNKRYVKTSDNQIEDSVLVCIKAFNKASPPYETKPLQVKYRKGTRVVAERPERNTITRSTAHFKKVPFSSLVKPHPVHI